MKKISDIIFAISAIVGIISFIVMIVDLFFPPSTIGIFAAYLFGLCLTVCLIIGTPNDEGKGLFSSFKDDGL